MLFEKTIDFLTPRIEMNPSMTHLSELNHLVLQKTLIYIAILFTLIILVVSRASFVVCLILQFHINPHSNIHQRPECWMHEDLQLNPAPIYESTFSEFWQFFVEIYLVDFHVWEMSQYPNMTSTTSPSPCLALN